MALWLSRFQLSAYCSPEACWSWPKWPVPMLECHSLSHRCDSTKCLAWISGPCPLTILPGSSILLTTIFSCIKGSLRCLRIPRDFQTVLHLFCDALRLSCPFELDSPGTWLDSHFACFFCCFWCFLILYPPQLKLISHVKNPTECSKLERERQLLYIYTYMWNIGKGYRVS